MNIQEVPSPISAIANRHSLDAVLSRHTLQRHGRRTVFESLERREDQPFVGLGLSAAKPLCRPFDDVVEITACLCGENNLPAWHVTFLRA